MESTDDDNGNVCDTNVPHLMQRIVGTPGFIAPEMQETFEGFREGYSAQCDSWSLGVMAFVLLSGRAPFRIPAPKANGDASHVATLREKLVPLLDKQCHAPIFSGFHTREWFDVGKDAKRFVQQMMHPEMGHRLSAAEGLEHAFLQSRHKDRAVSQAASDGTSASSSRDSYVFTESINIEALRGVMPRIERYLSFSDLKRSVAIVVASLLDREDPAAVEEARRAFVAVDKSRDGELDAVEFARAINLVHIDSELITPDSAADILRRLNVLIVNDYEHEEEEKQTNTTGAAITQARSSHGFGQASNNKEPTISFTEFVSATLDFDKYMTPLWVGKAFDALSLHGMGFVDAEQQGGHPAEETSGGGEGGKNSHVRIKSGLAAGKISKMLDTNSSEGMSRGSVLRMVVGKPDGGPSHDMSGKSVVGANIAFLDAGPEDVNGESSSSDKKTSAGMTRQSLIESVCGTNALLRANAKSSCKEYMGPKKNQKHAPPAIDEPDSSGDEHETEESAVAKLTADLAFFAQRTS